MARLKVAGWWLAFALARAWLWLWVCLLLLPMRLLEWLAGARDAAEIEWLLAGAARRLAQRRRDNLVQMVRDSIRPFPGRSVGGCGVGVVCHGAADCGDVHCPGRGVADGER